MIHRGASPPARCPSDDVLQELVLGTLGPIAHANLEPHLDRCEACREVVTTLFRDHGSLRGTDEVVAPGDDADLDGLRPGARLGRFRIEAVVGTGASGTVLTAHDPDLDRLVALKVLKDPGANGVERMMREAKAIARVSHPNVVAIHEVGTHHGRVYLAMELVSGATVADWIAVPRPWRAIVECFLQAARGLAAAHAAGLVHRDVKPSNLLFGADGVVRVADFGLASGNQPPTHRSGDGLTPEALETVSEPGKLVGTPAYMAPEQIRGDRVDHAADQFSLCVSLFEALHGRRPFGGTKLAELRENIEHRRLVASAGWGGAPRALQRIVLRGLAADPRARFPSMAAFVAALTRVQHVRRTRIAAAAAVAVMGIGVVIGGKALSATAPVQCKGVDKRMAASWNDARKRRIQHRIEHLELPYGDTVWRTVSSHLDDWSTEWSAMRAEACEATRVRREQSRQLLDLRVQCLDERWRAFEVLVHRLEQATRHDVETAMSEADYLPSIESCSAAAMLGANGSSSMWFAASARGIATRAGPAKGAFASDARWRHSTTPRGDWHRPGFQEDASWKPSIEQAPYGLGPWGTMAPFPKGTAARWIWRPNGTAADGNEMVAFRREFVASGSTATLALTADSAADVYLDGELIGTSSNWIHPLSLPLALVPGRTYALAVNVTNQSGVGGLLVDVAQEPSNSPRFGTDAQWRRSVAPVGDWRQREYVEDDSWTAATEQARYGAGPWKADAPFPPATRASWIWSYDSSTSNDFLTVYFRREFVPTSSSATLTIAGDNNLEVYVNGTFQGIGTYWYRPLTIELTDLPIGVPSVIAVKATNLGGPGGLIADVR